MLVGAIVLLLANGIVPCVYNDPYKSEPLAVSKLPCTGLFNSSSTASGEFLAAVGGHSCIEYELQSDSPMSVCFANAAVWAARGAEMSQHPRFCPCTSSTSCLMHNGDLQPSEMHVLYASPDLAGTLQLYVELRACRATRNEQLRVDAVVQRQSVASFDRDKKRQFAAALGATVHVGAADSKVQEVRSAGADATRVKMLLLFVNSIERRRAERRIKHPSFSAAFLNELSGNGYFKLDLLPSAVTFTVAEVAVSTAAPAALGAGQLFLAALAAAVLLRLGWDTRRSQASDSSSLGDLQALNQNQGATKSIEFQKISLDSDSDGEESPLDRGSRSRAILGNQGKAHQSPKVSSRELGSASAESPDPEVTGAGPIHLQRRHSNTN